MIDDAICASQQRNALALVPQQQHHWSRPRLSSTQGKPPKQQHRCDQQEGHTLLLAHHADAPYVANAVITLAHSFQASRT